LETSQEIYAVKKYSLSSEDFSNEESVINEINFLRELKMCENIVQLHAVYVNYNHFKKEYELSLVMNYAKDGTLFNVIRRSK
jgi:serine/threonine protein kinase